MSLLKKNFLRQLWNSFQSLDTHIKITIISLLLLIVITPIIVLSVLNYQTITSRGQGTPSVQWLHTQGNKIVNESGQTVMLRGVNIENREWVWNSGRSADQNISFEKLAIPKATGSPSSGNWGANVILIAVASGSINRNETNYLEAIDKIVALAKSNNAYTLVVYRYGEPNAQQAKMPDQAAENAMAKLAGRYAGEPAVLYGLQVEPDNVSWDQVKPRFTTMIDAIRSQNSKALVIVPVVSNTGWSNNLDEAVASPINKPNLVWKVHLYDSWSSIQSRVDFQKVLDAGYPMLIGEFGDHAGWQNLIDYAETKGISWIGWLFHEKGCPCMLSNASTFTTNAFGQEIKTRLQSQYQGPPIITAFPTPSPTLPPPPPSPITSKPTIAPSPITQLTPTPTSSPKPTLTTNATFSPLQVAVDNSIDITADVTSSLNANVLVDIEIYNPSGVYLKQTYFDNQILIANVKRSFKTSWKVPSGSPLGTYTVKVGVFNVGWKGQMKWNNNAGQFKVISAPISNNPPTLIILNPDVNNDGGININEITGVIAAFGSAKGDSRYKPEFDLDGNGGINGNDISLIGSYFGLTWPPTNFKSGSTMTLYVTGSDPDGNALTYSAAQLPLGSTFNASSRKFQWTPNNTQIGTYTVTFKVSDGKAVTSQNLSIGVIP